MKKNTLFLIFLFLSVTLFGQGQNYAIHSRGTFYVAVEDEAVREEYSSPSIPLDVFYMYDTKAKSKTVRVFSNQDTFQVKVKVNKGVDFLVINKNDTAHHQLLLVNQLPNNITVEEKLEALSSFWSEVRYNFAFYDKLTFDWDSLYHAYIPLVLRSPNDFAYSELMSKFCGSLQDAHTNVFTPNYGYPFGDYYGFGAKFFEDTLRLVIVDSILSSIYPIGSKILKINGENIDDYMEKNIYPYVSSKFKPTQQVLGASKLFAMSGYDNTLEIEYETPEGERRIGTPIRDGEKYRRPSVGRTPEHDHNDIRISWIDSTNIAVLKVNSFYGDDIIRDFDRMKDTLYTADGIIFDIRENGGGSTDVAWHFLNHFIQDPYYLNFAWQTRVNDGVKKATGNFIEKNSDYFKMNAYRMVEADTILIPDSIRRFQCPIVVLTSTYTCSAAEDFLIILYERPDRPKIIGQPSFGSTGSPLVIWNWPIEGGFARICTRRVLFPYSHKPFTEGIMPDVWVKDTFEDYIQGRDKTLEVAVKEIKQSIGNR